MAEVVGELMIVVQVAMAISEFAESHRADSGAVCAKTAPAQRHAHRQITADLNMTVTCRVSRPSQIQFYMKFGRGWKSAAPARPITTCC